MIRLLIATTNPGKLREIRRILCTSNVDLLSLREFTPVPEPEETGATFEDNARLKALYYDDTVTAPAAAVQCGPLYTVAEDSGLEIDALDGQPGVHSARFVAALAVVQGSAVVYEARGVVEGEIAMAARGEHGFGYDPIFFHPPLGCTLGEASDAQKELVGHRGKAFRQLATWLGIENGEQGACPPFR